MTEKVYAFCNHLDFFHFMSHMGHIVHRLRKIQGRPHTHTFEEMGRYCPDSTGFMYGLTDKDAIADAVKVENFEGIELIVDTDGPKARFFEFGQEYNITYKEPGVNWADKTDEGIVYVDKPTGNIILDFLSAYDSMMSHSSEIPVIYASPEIVEKLSLLKDATSVSPEDLIDEPHDGPE